MPAIEYLPISWNTYCDLSQSLAEKILADHKPIGEIVAISRGGLTLGHVLSDFLNVSISTIAIQSYTDIQAQGEVKITARLQTPIRDKHILLVDDVADSGKTLKRAVSYLKEFTPASVTTVTLFYKPQSVIRPDYIGEETTKWILFPYEVREMISLITQNMAKENATLPAIDKFLETLGYTKKQIAFVRSH